MWKIISSNVKLMEEHSTNVMHMGRISRFPSKISFFFSKKKPNTNRALLPKNPGTIGSIRIVATLFVDKCNVQKTRNWMTNILCIRHIVYCNTLQHTATHCNTLQHTATHCNTLQHTATHCQHIVYCVATIRMLPIFLGLIWKRGPLGLFSKRGRLAGRALLEKEADIEGACSSLPP